MYCACEKQQTEIGDKEPWLMGGIKKRKRRPRLIAASGPKANHTYTSMPGASRTRTALKTATTLQPKPLNTGIRS